MHEEDLLVSVIIPTYKRGTKLVDRALSSVAAQTYPYLEIIVIDDSPADFDQREDVQKLVEGYQYRNAKYIAHEESKGACAARNTGLAVAKGEFIAFLDDDDEWLPEKIASQIEKLEDEKVALVYSGFYSVNDTTGAKTTAELIWLKGFVFDKLLEDNYIGPTSTPLIRKKCILEIGGFDEKMQSAQDYDVWLRLAQKYAVDYCKEPLMVYHIHDGVRITTNYKKKIAGLERIAEKYHTYLKKNRKAMGMSQVIRSPFYAGDGQIFKALRLWCCGVCKCPGLAIWNLKCLKWLLSNYSKSRKSRKQ